MEEIVEQAEEDLDTAPNIGGDDEPTAEVPTAELEVLTAEVVDTRDPRAGGNALVLAEPLPRDLHPCSCTWPPSRRDRGVRCAPRSRT
jgi:hypothetical protein